MQKLFIIGSTTGQLIASMKRMIQDFYPIAFDTQYRVPNATNYNLFAAPDSDEDKVADVTRPSDYRLKNSMATAAVHRKSNIRKRFKEIIDPFSDSIDR